MDYLFYRIYTFWYKPRQRNFEVYTTFLISVLFFINLLSISLVLIRLHLIYDYLDNKINVKILSASVFLFNYFYFNGAKKYLNIIEKYSLESFEERKRKNIFLIYYLLVTMILGIIPFFLSK
jgi:hypothetical protein